MNLALTGPLSLGAPIFSVITITAFDPSTNRISNLPCAASVQSYDAAGNQLCDSDLYGAVRQYSYDAEDRISQISAINSQASPFVSYAYGAEGDRVRKTNADGSFTEYVTFGGQPIAERNADGQWTDYVYANGKKIAMNAPINSLWLHGSNGDPVEVTLQIGVPQNIPVLAGDRLNWWQYQQSSGGVLAGMNLGFDNGWQLNGTCSSCPGQPAAAVDQNGAQVDRWSGNFGWTWRSADLSAYAGHSVNGATLVKDINSPWGGWDIMISLISITHQNGEVDVIYDGVNNVALNYPVPPEVHNTWGTYFGDAIGAHTRFYVADHLGSAQEEFTAGGYPLWKGHFLPFGGEINPQATANRYKFTGKERDTETGNDYFGARYYSSNMGRWMSPDWSLAAEAVPYAKLDDPQSLNLYAYVHNNPMNLFDADGHEESGSGDFNGGWNSAPGSEIYGSGGVDGFFGDPSRSSTAALELITQSFWGTFAQSNPAQQNANRQSDGSYKATPDQLADLRAKADKKQHVYSPHDPDGQCVTACERFTGVPGPTASWTRGKSAGDLTDADIGTAIATFDGDHYGGTPKNSGVFMGKGVGGIWFADQWPKADGNKPVSIWFMPTNDARNPGNSAMSASYYHVIIVK